MMASAVSVPEAAKKLKNNIHSGGDSADDAKRAGESSEDLSDNEVDSRKDYKKPVTSESDDKESDDEKPIKKEAPKKESKPKKPDAPVKRNGTTKETTTVKSTLMMDSNAAEAVKSEGGRRERKQVERFSIIVETPAEKPVVIPHGAGTKLVDIPFVADQINRNVAANLAVLHRLFFGRRGQTHEIKKNLRQFSGFGIEEVSPEYQRKKALITKWDAKLLKQTCDYLGLLKKGTKEQVVERIIQFCLKPTDNGLKVKVKKSKSGSKKSSSTKRKSSKSSERSKPKSKSEKKSKGSDVSDDDDDDDADQQSDDHDKKKKKRVRPVSDEDEEDEPPKKKKGRDGPTRQAATGKRYAEDDGDDWEQEKVSKKKSSPAKRPRKDSSDDDDDVSKSESEKEDDASSDEKHKKKSSSSSKSKSSSAKKSSSSKKLPPTKTKSKPKPAPKKAKVELSESESDKESVGRKSPEKDDDNSSADEKTIDEEIKSFLVNRIKNASADTLKKITVKTLLHEVGEKYPSIDKAEKKSYIKTCINEILGPST